jgi:hypothetical protein
MLLAKIFFILGVRASGILIDCDFCGTFIESDELRAGLLLVAAVGVCPGMISVWIRSPALKGLALEVRISIGRSREVVSR